MRALPKQLLLIAGLTLAGAASATPTIGNGGFDTNLNGWILGGGCANPAFTAAGNGTGAANLDSCGEDWTDPSVGQVVSGLIVGHNYRLSWDQKLADNWGGSGGGGKSFGVFLGADGGNALYTNEYLEPTWKAWSTTFVATSASQLITFAGELDMRTAGVPWRTDVSYLLDNVALSDASTAAVPEPASLMLVGLGLAGVLAARRKRA